MTDRPLTPEQAARYNAEQDLSTRYADGRPKMHRHFAEYDAHPDEACDRPGTRRRVYVFDTEYLDAHEAHITVRERDAATAETLDLIRNLRNTATGFQLYETRDAGDCYNADGVNEFLAALDAVLGGGGQ